MTESTTQDSGETLAVTVHGSPGAVDLLVPVGASVADLAREYALSCGLPQSPALLTRTGQRLDPVTHLGSSGVTAGAVLVAAESLPPVTRAGTGEERRHIEAGAGPGVALWFGTAALLGVLAAAVGAQTDSAMLLTITVDLLVAAAVIGVLPFGRYVHERAMTAPVFLGAAAYILVWEPGQTRFAITVGVAALAAAVGAAVGRALGSGARVVQDVWIISGLTVFAVTALTLLAGVETQVTWAILLVLAMLAARSVPGLAIDAPDQMLIDLEKLAITAWSARDRLPGRRGRMVVPPQFISDLLERGSHIVNAAAAAVLGVVALAVPGLLDTAVHDLDRQGAQLLVFCAGAVFLLAGRSYRHRPARVLLGSAGIIAWAWLAASLLTGASGGARLYAVVGAFLLASVVVVSAVAIGRGWRSVWWARRAEVAETLVGALGVAAVVMASGLFRQIWELKSGG